MNFIDCLPAGIAFVINILKITGSSLFAVDLNGEQRIIFFPVQIIQTLSEFCDRVFCISDLFTESAQTLRQFSDVVFDLLCIKIVTAGENAVFFPELDLQFVCLDRLSSSSISS